VARTLGQTKIGIRSILSCHNNTESSIFTFVECTAVDCDPASHSGQLARYVSAIKDLHRLRPLLLLAFEEEIKRKDVSGDDGEPTPAAAN